MSWFAHALVCYFFAVLRPLTRHHGIHIVPVWCICLNQFIYRKYCTNHEKAFGSAIIWEDVCTRFRCYLAPRLSSYPSEARTENFKYVKIIQASHVVILYLKKYFRLSTSAGIRGKPRNLLISSRTANPPHISCISVKGSPLIPPFVKTLPYTLNNQKDKIPKDIQNLGNICFANSILQPLMSVSTHGNGLLHMQHNRSRCLTGKSLFTF